MYVFKKKMKMAMALFKKKKNRKKVVNPIIHPVFTRFAADDHDLSVVCK